jgi:hypothetical protein
MSVLIRNLVCSPKLDDGLLHGHVSAKVTNLILQALGPEQIARLRVRFNSPQLNFASGRLFMQYREHHRAGNIGVGRVRHVADSQLNETEPAIFSAE